MSQVIFRWDGAFDTEFDTVEEVTYCAHTFLEVFFHQSYTS